MLENEIWENLTISNDFLFSKLMRDREICKEIVETLLNIELEKIEYIEEQKSIDIVIDAKSIRLDAYIKGDDKIFNIEMQVAKDKDLAKRSRYYQGMIDLNSIEKGAKYSKLKTSYVVFICTFDPFDKDLACYEFENFCKQDKDLALNDRALKVFFNTKATSLKNHKSNMEAFLKYVNGEKTENNFISKIDKMVSNIKDNKKWRTEYMTLHMRDQENFDKGIEIGLDKGIKIGVDKGIKIGVDKGRQEGRLEEKIDIIKNLLPILNDTQISESTGLDINQVAKIREELS